MRKLSLIVIYVCFSSQVWSSELVIPSTRRITWQGNVGVAYCSNYTNYDQSTCEAAAGTWTVGIPSGWSNCVTAECNTLYAGTVTHTSINAAVVSAPDNTVVRIPSGTFSISGLINIDRDNVILRGSGRTSTILNTTNVIGIQTSSGGWSVYDTGTISSGYTLGSTSVVLNATTNMTVGDMLKLSQTDESYMWNNSGGTTNFKQPVLITSITGTTVTFTPPLVHALTAGLNPTWSAYYGYYIAGLDARRYIGIEDLTISQTDIVGGGTTGINFLNTFGCWVKNVEIKDFGNAGFNATNSVRGTVRDSYIHDTITNYEGYGVTLASSTSGMLIENNAFANMFSGFITYDTVGTVIAYNYGYNIGPKSPGQAYDFINLGHGTHSMKILIEGNYGSSIINDGYNVSGSHHTIFRNNFDGLNPTYTLQHRRLINLCRFSQYHNVVGNVLGSATWTAETYELITGDRSAVDSAIYRLNFPAMGNNNYFEGNSAKLNVENECIDESGSSSSHCAGRDTDVQATLLRHKNYDYKNGTQRVCGDESEGCQSASNVLAGDTIPNSLYLSSKPSWFESLTWPPIDPSVPSVGTIPAKYFYENGSWPSPSQRTIFRP